VDYIAIRDSRAVGVGHAKGALEFAPPNKSDPPKYVLIKGDGRQANALLFESFWREVLDPYVKEGSIKIVADQYHDGWSGEKALATAENVLTAQKDDVDAFVTMNDSMAVGVAQALMARGLQGKVYLCGQDADKANLRLIVEGVQTLTYYTRITDLAHVAIEGAHALAAGQKPRVDGQEDMGFGPVPAGYCKVDQIKKDNMCNFLTKIVPKDWISVEDVFVSVPVPAECK
jgi:D-xylose transport system substrate-binding protein